MKSKQHKMIKKENEQMIKPTLEEYNQAKQNTVFALRALQSCRNERDRLIDALVEARNDEKRYLKMLEEYKEVVLIYDTYEKIEKGNGE
jgi:hypothetical protein